MIYIKTNMTEMPKSCWACKYEKISLGRLNFCKFTDMETEYFIESRPDWCPLVEITEDEND